MDTTPLVSVLIPTYNCGIYLKEAIESVLSQTFQDFELIIVDNNSTDNTTEVVKPYLESSRILYIKNSENIGLVGNWNKCLFYARGKYIKFLCADDKFHPLLLEKFVSVMERFPSVALVCSYRREFGENICDRDAPFQHLQPGKKIIFETLSDRNWLGEPSTVMFRRSNLDVGLFKEGFTWIVDWEMWLRQLTKGDCYIIPEFFALIRRHPNQVTELVFKNYIHCFEEYQLSKMVSENAEYEMNGYDFDLKRVRRKRARYFRVIMVKLLPKLHKKTSRSAFIRAFKILHTENAYL